MVQKTEFSVDVSYATNRSSAVAWMLSHIRRYWWLLVGAGFAYIIGYGAFSYSNVFLGQAAEEIINPTGAEAVALLAFAVLVARALDGIASLAGSLALETLANLFERNARHELYTSLLGKSQTFHDRQRVGDVMARVTDDVRQLNFTISPGVIFIFDMFMGFAVPMFVMATIRLELLLVPLLFLLTYVVFAMRYIRRLDPVVQEQRGAYGVMNAGLEETISGIEIVKVAAQEEAERGRFRRNARRYRNLFVQQGRIEAGYLPLLIFGLAYGLVFLHTIVLYQQNLVGIAEIVAVVGLMGILRFPVFISLFSISLIQLGVASARRILTLINEETDLDENTQGFAGKLEGAITFDNVSFGYEDGLVIKDMSFSIQPGETVAVVGQTGSGKSTVMQLLNRTYDVSDGRVLIDGVDVRDWSLNALRSQISKIEQDVFLFSRTIAENIAFGKPEATQAEIEQAAKEAQAHDFILRFADGYQTKVGERGVTLSGGQRQRIALARAFLSNPSILILDDSTSAIDSATEDEIQKALRRAQEGRTMLLITHRLSQIRWADHILVLEGGRLIASGQHETLLRESPHYRRIFARYDAALPSGTEVAIEAAGD